MDQLKSFRYRNVLLTESHWEQQRSEIIDLYLAVDNDDLLHYFRTLAGIPSLAKGLMGWYGQDADTFGQLIAAFVKLYLVTGEERLKEKVIYLCDEWGRCAHTSKKVIDVNGTYVYDKLMGGFADMYEYLNYQPARDYMRILTESAMARFPTGISRDGLQDAGLCDTNMIEWYTLPEHIYRAYLLTGEQLYFDFANQWEYDYLWNKLKNSETDIGPRHAYSQVNSLSSAAMAYAVKEDDDYLEMLERAYEQITKNHTFATGGYGPAECMFTEYDGYLGDSLKDAWDATKKKQLYRNFGDSMMPRNDNWGSCEVSCCSWAVFKYSNYMLRFTGKAKYADWAEKLLYNGTGGQIPITQKGKVMYYAGYFVDGALKTTEDRRIQPRGAVFEWQCCTGTFPQDVAEYANMLYYFSGDCLYVSQYLPSVVTWEEKGIVLENHSDYPQKEELRFTVSCPETISTAIAWRVPAWAKEENVILINGAVYHEQSAKAGEWLRIEREWSCGDEIILRFPFSLRFEPVDKENPDIAALCYGPLVLATDRMGILLGDIKRPADWIEKLPGEAMAFETKKGHVKGYDFDTRIFRPYYSIGEMTWYYMYCKIETEPAS